MFLIKFCAGASPMAEWLSLCAPLQRPRVLPVRFLGADMAPLIRPCWGGVPHATTRRTHNHNTQLCTGGLWGEKKGKKKRLATVAAQVPIFKIKKKNYILWDKRPMDLTL